MAFVVIYLMCDNASDRFHLPKQFSSHLPKGFSCQNNLFTVDCNDQITKTLEALTFFWVKSILLFKEF
jgi:hypothetical protein